MLEPLDEARRPVRRGRELEAWETSAPGPYVTIRAGGPHDGVVTITAAAAGRVVVEAAWGSRYARTSISVQLVGHAAADVLAHAWASELAAGREPVAE